MTPAEISQYLGLALAVIALLGHAKGYFSSGQKTLSEDVSEAKKKIIEHDRRIQTIEGEMKHLPNKDTVNKLQVDMTELKGDIALIAKSSEATERATRRVEEFLLHHDK
jgi:phage shock protein A